MGQDKQLELFPPDTNDRLNAAQAEMRRERAAREATRPGAKVYVRRGRHRFSRFHPQPEARERR